MLRVVSSLYALLVALAAPEVGLAQEETTQSRETATEQYSAALREAALIVADEGQAAFRRGEFDTAGRLAERAYAIFTEPGLLYNAGRAFESGGHNEQALAAYRRFLGEAGEEDESRGQVERRVTILEQRIVEAERLRRVAEVTRRELAEAQARSDAIGIVPWTFTITGGLGLGGGAVFGAIALERHGAAAADPVNLTAIETEALANDLALVSSIAFIAGGALALTGIVWLIVGALESRSAEATVLSWR